jgi:hypothetical protein
MPHTFTPKVVTASDLLEGDVIYLTSADTWSRHLSEAEVLEDEADAQIRLLLAESQPDRIVGAYLAEVSQGPDGPKPTHFREAFRAKGPSNHHHGKQELVD